MIKQLYSFAPDIEYPKIARVDRISGEITPVKEKQPGYFSFVWPNATPCVLVEMFLQDKSRQVKISKNDGGTVGNYASRLSHLVRYCFNNKINFWELTHDDIDEFILDLVDETDKYGERKRNNNTVKSIISDCMAFLEWVQTNITIDRNIVGINSSTIRFQIRLVEKSFSLESGKKISSAVFPSVLPASTTDPKRPISKKVIRKLWDALANSKAKAKCSNKLKGRFTKSEQADHIEYMHKRRELQLVMLEATGLRPQELTTTRASENIDRLKSSTILLPTLKKRRPSERLIPIDRSVAMRVEVFIVVHRKKLIERLIRAGIINNEKEVDDYIYLNPENGKGVMPDAAYKEFGILVKKAGINQKTCQSMFRHAFITNMVALHLSQFMDKNPLKSRHIMTDSDYRTILTKVSKFTGHKSTESLFHYIDLAWEKLGIFSDIYEIKELQGRLNSVFYSAHSIRADLNLLKQKPSRKLVNKIIQQVSELEDITRMAI